MLQRIKWRGSTPTKKINFDKDTRLLYLLGHGCTLIDASTYGAATDADNQFEIFASSASEKKNLILKGSLSDDFRETNHI